jgi:hypothetical protein
MHPTLATLMVAHDAAEAGDEALRERMLDELVDCERTRHTNARRWWSSHAARARETNYSRSWAQEMLRQDWLAWQEQPLSAYRTASGSIELSVGSGHGLQVGDMVSISTDGLARRVTAIDGATLRLSDEREQRVRIVSVESSMVMIASTRDRQRPKPIWTAERLRNKRRARKRGRR